MCMLQQQFDYDREKTSIFPETCKTKQAPKARWKVAAVGARTCPLFFQLRDWMTSDKCLGKNRTLSSRGRR